MIGGEQRLKRVDNRAADTFMDEQQIAMIPRRRARPQYEAISDAVQLGRDTQSLLELTHAAFDDRVGLQTGLHFFEIVSASLKALRRPPRYNTNGFKPGERRRKLSSQSIAESALIAIGGEVIER